MKRTEASVLFVELREPAANRRDVLMATKDVLDCLKRYEEYKATRQQKQQAVKEFKRVLDEVSVLNRKLRSKMPKAPITLPDIHDDASAREKEEGEYDFKGTAPIAARPKSKLDVLQEELEKIEERLGALE